MQAVLGAAYPVGSARALGRSLPWAPVPRPWPEVCDAGKVQNRLGLEGEMYRSRIGVFPGRDCHLEAQ